MMRKAFRKIHKWVFIFTGVFTLLWVLTGVVITLPEHSDWEKLRVSDKVSLANYRDITLSPAEVLVKLKNERPLFEYARSIHFENIQGKILYAIQDQDGETHLINALTGEYYVFSEKLAELFTREIFSIKEAVNEITLVNNYSIDYLWGELPVYRLKFEGRASEIFYVSPVSSKVFRSTSFGRIANIAGFLHNFAPIRTFSGSDALRWGFMLFVGLVILVGTVTGVYLTLPKRKKRL